jgi:hypothetical protein
MKTTKTFESWYTMIMEGELATTTATATTVDTEAPTISNDVETIMTSLETLAKELTEELSGEEFNQLNEDGAGAPGKVMQWIWWMPKARKAQAKINKIKLNIVDMESAAADAPDAQQRARINAKAKLAKDQVPELQKMLHDKFSDKGTLVQKAISSEKLAGQIASIRRATGLEDDPEVKATYKDKMIELQAKYKEDEAAIRQLEPSDADKKAEKERREREAEDNRKRQETLDADAKKSREDLAKADGKSEKSAEEIEQDKQDALDAEAKAKGSSTDPADDTKKADPTDDTKKADPADDTKKADPTDDTKNTKEGKLKRLGELLAKAKESGDEEKVKKVQALIDKIAAKESWQLEGTTLGMMLESEITKLEMSFTLNEAKYQNLSVKERFSRLM